MTRVLAIAILAAAPLAGCASGPPDPETLEQLQTREYDVDKAVAWRAVASTALDLGYGFTVSDYEAGLMGVGMPYANPEAGSFLWMKEPGNPSFQPIGAAWIRPARAGRTAVRIAVMHNPYAHTPDGTPDRFWDLLGHRIALRGLPTTEEGP